MQNTINFFKTIFLVFLCALLGYNIYLGVRKQIPCLDPIPYAIGDFSTQFKVSEDYFLKALKDAEDVWEVSYGKDLFVYNPEYTKSDLLKVNLIYDYRQAATTKLDSLSEVVETDQQKYDNQEAKYRSLKAGYTRDVRVLDARVALFNKQSKEYETEVDYWNKRIKALISLIILM